MLNQSDSDYFNPIIYFDRGITFDIKSEKKKSSCMKNKINKILQELL